MAFYFKTYTPRWKCFLCNVYQTLLNRASNFFLAIAKTEQRSRGTERSNTNLGSRPGSPWGNEPIPQYEWSLYQLGAGKQRQGPTGPSVSRTDEKGWNISAGFSASPWRSLTLHLLIWRSPRKGPRVLWSSEDQPVSQLRPPGGGVIPQEVKYVTGTRRLYLFSYTVY